MSRAALSVLLVEDDVSYATYLAQVFTTTESRTQFKHVTSLTAAFDSDPATFDAILVDLELPDASGLEAVSALRQRVPSLPLIVLTSKDDALFASQAIQAGAQDYVVKSEADPQVLLRALRYSIERSWAQERARDFERRYQDLFESSPLAMWVYDVISLRFLAVNDAALRAYGYSRDEFLQMTLLDVPLGSDANREARSLIASTAGSRSSIARHRRKDGSLLDARVTSHDLNFGGRVARLVLSEDVTEQLAAERRLQFLADAGAALGSLDIRSSLDSVAGLVARTIADVGVVVLVDETGAVEQVHFGHADPRFLARLEALNEGLRSGRLKLPSAYLDVMEHGTGRIEHEINERDLPRFVSAEALKIFGGSLRSVMIAPLRGRGGLRGAVSFLSLHEGRRFSDKDLVVADDLASRIVMAVENARLLTEARELFDADLTANFIAAADGSILACNETFVHLLQFADVETARKHNAAELFVERERWSEFVQEVAEARDVRQREMELRARDGSHIHALASAVGLFDERHGLLRVRGQFYDLTAHKQLELRFSQLQKFEAIGRLAGGIAHDFNNLLTLIGGRVERLQIGLPLGEPLRKSVDEVASAAERAAGLTAQLLAFSRRQVLTPKVISINGVVDSVHGMLTRLLGEHVSIELSLTAEVSAVRADQGRLEQALLNLAINARDAMPDGGTLSISTADVDIDEVYTRQHVGADPGRYVRLTVSDTGHGMDRETRERVFEPFFTTKEVGKGTGLGLATVYGIVKQSGGHIWVYSEVGLGTTFKIYLPAVDAPIDIITERPVRTAPTGSETILLVEDEDGVRELIDEVLTARGYQVLAASRGMEALQIAEFVESDIHLLVTDVVMPQMSGREVVMRLAPGRPNMRVLYLSGYTDDLILQHGALEPGAAFLQKPFGATDLAQKVRDVLSGTSQVN
jgi:two-component system, cell cycle sensor histidine kinase and response regulator CckA